MKSYFSMLSSTFHAHECLFETRPSRQKPYSSAMQREDEHGDAHF